MERHGAIGRFRMCAGLMLRRHAANLGFVVIGGKKLQPPGAKKPGRKARVDGLKLLWSVLGAVTKSVWSLRSIFELFSPLVGEALGPSCELKSVTLRSAGA